MYRCSVDKLVPGQQLGKTLYNERGDVLLGAGTTLTAPYIAALQRHSIAAVYVRDGLSDDVVPANIVAEQVRSTVSGHVSKVFDEVGRIGAARASDGERAATVDEAIERLGPGELPLRQDGLDAIQTLYQDIENLMTEILEGETVASLESLKSHNTYTFQHSVDVAILGILMGRRAGLGREQLRELALGGLLHDIGKSYIDHALLDKAGPLSRDEFEEMKKHPFMGFELVRRMPIFSILPAHVAYQHHERQNGGGYPRGLVGSNKIARTSAERLDPRRMLLIAEIGAVADVYSAISSDRPYRPAMAPDEIVRVMEKMAGHHLNREVVRLLLRTVPPYPVGQWVEVVAGRYKGWRGVVTQVHRETIDEPSVRLVLDERREPASNPVEVDVREDPEVRLVCVPPDGVPFLDDKRP